MLLIGLPGLRRRIEGAKGTGGEHTISEPARALISGDMRPQRLLLGLCLSLLACDRGGEELGDASVVDARPTEADAGQVPPVGSATVSGTFGGGSFRARSAVYFFDHDVQRGDLLIVALADVPDLCAQTRTGQLTIEIFQPWVGVAGASLLTWNAFGRDEAGAAGTIEPGTIPLGIQASSRPPASGGDYGYPLISRTSSQCVRATYEYDLETIQAELVLERFPRQDGLIRGRFTIKEANEVLEGTFSAVPCSLGTEEDMCR